MVKTDNRQLITIKTDNYFEFFTILFNLKGLYIGKSISASL